MARALLRTSASALISRSRPEPATAHGPETAGAVVALLRMGARTGRLRLGGPSYTGLTARLARAAPDAACQPVRHPGYRHEVSIRTRPEPAGIRWRRRGNFHIS